MEGKSSSGFSSPKAFYRNSQAQKSGERISVISRNRPPSFKRAKRVTFSLIGPFIMPDRFVLPYGNGLWIVSKKTTVRSISFIGKGHRSRNGKETQEIPSFVIRRTTAIIPWPSERVWVYSPQA